MEAVFPPAIQIHESASLLFCRQGQEIQAVSKSDGFNNQKNILIGCRANELSGLRLSQKFFESVPICDSQRITEK
jgi:hypothetical protein